MEEAWMDLQVGCLSAEKLGCWIRHVEIIRAAYEKTLDVLTTTAC